MIEVILAVLALFVLQTLLPGIFRYLVNGPGVGARLKIALGPRDNPPPLPVPGARADLCSLETFEAKCAVAYAVGDTEL